MADQGRTPDTDSHAAGCVLVPLAVVIAPAGWALWAWTITTLWGWYAVSVLGEPDAMLVLGGILAFLVVRFFTTKLGREFEGDYGGWFVRFLVKQFLSPLLLLWIGWGAGLLLGLR